MRELIERAIARLPETHREVYVLADIGHLRNGEIGESLQLGVPAVARPCPSEPTRR
jgi:DNA-directed RNA polymerase specialized sigma24 family protein